MYHPDIPDLDHIQNFMTSLHIFEFKSITMIHLDKNIILLVLKSFYTEY